MSKVRRSGHSAEYAKWLNLHESERLRRGLSPGQTVSGFPRCPPTPGEVSEIVISGKNALGHSRAAALCNVHRTTVLRWLDGSVQIPDSAFALLRFHWCGVPPGLGDVWQGFQWEDSALISPGGLRITVHELMGWEFKAKHVQALKDRITALMSEIDYLKAAVNWGCQNDAWVYPDAATSLKSRKG